MADETLQLIGKDGLIDVSQIKTLEQFNKTLSITEKEFESLAQTLSKNEKELKDLAKIQEKVIRNSGNDQKEVLKQEESARKLNEQYKELVKKQKELTKAQSELTKIRKASTQATLQEKEAAKENAKQARLVARAKNQTKGSVEELRTRLSLVTLEWSKLTAQELENTKRGQRLVNSKKKLTEQLKKLEKATGDNRREVGNYSGAIKEAATEVGVFGGSLGRAIAITKSAQAALLATSRSLGTFKLALIGTGIGALVVALGSLVTFLQKSQKGIDFVNQSLAVLGQIADEVTDVAIRLGEKIFEAFTNPKQTIIDLGNAIVDNIVNRFEGLALIGDAVVKLFNDFTDTQAWEDLGNAVTQTTTGITDASGKAKEAAQTIGDIVSNAVEDSEKALELEKRRQALERKEVDFIVTRAKLENEIAEARKNANDDTLDAQTRLDNINKAINLTANLQTQTSEIEKERLDITKTQNTLATSTLEDVKEEKILEADLLKTERQRDETLKTLFARRKSINNELNKTLKTEQKITGEQAKQTQQVEDQFKALDKTNEEQDEAFKQKLSDLDQQKRSEEEINDVKKERTELENEILSIGKEQLTQLVQNETAARILNAALDQVINKALSGSTGVGGGDSGSAAAGALRGGFADGGYTGDGGKYDVAGLVHKGEFVIDKETTSALGLQNATMSDFERFFMNDRVVNEQAQIDNMRVAFMPKQSQAQPVIDEDKLATKIASAIPQNDFANLYGHLVFTQKQLNTTKKIVSKDPAKLFHAKVFKHSAM